MNKKEACRFTQFASQQRLSSTKVARDKKHKSLCDKIISVDNISITYDGKKILENISFDVENDDFLVIFGKNGSGKSSLVKTLLSIKAPSAGKIKFHTIKSSEIGYLPQISEAQRGFPASAWEVVLSGCLNKMKGRPFYGFAEKKKAQESLELLGICDLKNECFRNLSGGQQQRVLLARALCATGKLLLLDEPTAGLDPSATADFYEIISRINKRGVSVIMVSHDVHSSLSVAKHILHIGNNGVLFFGTPQEYEKSSITVNEAGDKNV